MFCFIFQYTLLNIEKITIIKTFYYNGQLKKYYNLFYMEKTGLNEIFNN